MIKKQWVMLNIFILGFGLLFSCGGSNYESDDSYRPSNFEEANGEGKSSNLLESVVWTKEFTPQVIQETGRGSVSTDPILRLNTEFHTSMIRRLAVDRDCNYLASSSIDKTVKIWSLPDCTLLQTLRPPIGDGTIGRMGGVAFTPDGSTVICTGVTRFAWQKYYSLYIFDRASGQMKQKVPGMGNTVNHLAVSSDGRILAAVCVGGSGLYLFRTSDYALIGSDSEYRDDSYYVDISPIQPSSNSYWVASSCYDGYVRLYQMELESDSATRLSLVQSFRSRKGDKLTSIVFSPDGTLVALGSKESLEPEVYSFDGNRLKYAYSPDSTNNDKRIDTLAWSKDGNELYGACTFDRIVNNKTEKLIRKWYNKGLGTYVDLHADNDTILHIVGLNNGSFAYGTGNPSLGIYNNDNERTVFKTSVKGDFRGDKQHFKTNHDGSKIVFGLQKMENHQHCYDLMNRQLLTELPLDVEYVPIYNAAGLSITDWKSSYDPKVNNRTFVDLGYDLCRSAAIAPDGMAFVLGCNYTIRKFNQSGGQLWSQPTKDVCWAINITGNNTMAITANADGVIRWLRMADGQELLSLFTHINQTDWIAWSPSGYYDCSAGSGALIGWHINQADDKEAQFYSVSRFRDQYYRPDVIAQIPTSLDENAALRIANQNAGQFRNEIRISQILPPTIQILSPNNDARITNNQVTLTYKVNIPEGSNLQEIRTLIDGRPLDSIRGFGSIQERPSTSSNTRTLTVSIPQRDCTVSILAINENGTSDPAQVRLKWAGASNASPLPSSNLSSFTIQPKLYVLAIGVSAYAMQNLRLRYSAKDARDFVQLMNSQEGSLYREVETSLLVDGDATQSNILDKLLWLQRSVTQHDVGMLFLSGHGVNDDYGDFYYLPVDADPSRLEHTCVMYMHIKRTLERLAGKAIFFFDTCHSGNIMGARRGPADTIAVVNDLSSAETGAVVFASSTGSQYSLESDEWGNGAFTKALLEAIRGNADFTNDGVISINELDLSLSETVKSLTQGRQTPTTCKPQTIQDFPIAVIE